MSTYNESEQELESSVSSILNQSHRNIEFIIVNDNPENTLLEQYLSKITDSRVIILKNEVNLGLVKSLNKALQYAKGNYIARMDADDIAWHNRLETQLSYLKDNNLDIVGSDIQLIDEDNKIIKDRVHFPSSEKISRMFIKYGNCMAHPTWLVKKRVYVDLNGYREVESCEDYDFIVRLMYSTEYHLGNTSEIGLQYRIRSSGVSKSSEAQQYVLRSFIAKNKKRINTLSMNDINLYIESEDFKKNVSAYKQYKKDKDEAKKYKNLTCWLKMLSNKFFYIIQLEKYSLKIRSML